MTHFFFIEKKDSILAREIDFARKNKGAFHSVHEMWGALAEEMDEILDHIRGKTYDTSAAHYEMIQAAGILLRYVDEHGDKAEIEKRQKERHER